MMYAVVSTEASGPKAKWLSWSRRFESSTVATIFWIIVLEYLSQNDHGHVAVVVIIILSLHHSWNTKTMYGKMFHKGNTMGAIDGTKPTRLPFWSTRVHILFQRGSCVFVLSNYMYPRFFLFFFCFVLLCPLWFQHSYDVRTPNNFVVGGGHVLFMLSVFAT